MGFGKGPTRTLLKNPRGYVHVVVEHPRLSPGQAVGAAFFVALQHLYVQLFPITQRVVQTSAELGAALAGLRHVRPAVKIHFVLLRNLHHHGRTVGRISRARVAQNVNPVEDCVRVQNRISFQAPYPELIQGLRRVDWGQDFVEYPRFGPIVPFHGHVVHHKRLVSDVQVKLLVVLWGGGTRRGEAGRSPSGGRCA